MNHPAQSPVVLTMEHQRERAGVSRRGALTGAVTAGLALPALAACGGGDPEAAPDPRPSTGRSETPATTETPETPQTPDGTATSTTPTEAAVGLLATGEVPVGGGVVLTGRRLVVTQPAKGDFRAFTAVCTHRGCLVESVTDTIDCPCHGSRFSIEDGTVVDGPAPSPLAAHRLVVRGDSIDLA